jgi:hypothetical protein
MPPHSYRNAILLVQPVEQKMRSLVIGTAAAAAALATSLAARAAEPAPPLAFNGVKLGTTRDAWRALKLPQSAPQHARRLCSDDPGAPAAGLTERDLPRDAVVCAVVDTYGTLRLPVTFAWRGGYAAEHVRYIFRAGRLAEIRAVLPADAFDALIAQLRRAYGPASQEIRDSVKSEIGKLPRVTERWLTPHGRIEIVDPSTPGRLSLHFIAG